jgi:hypothetical protein
LLFLLLFWLSDVNISTIVSPPFLRRGGIYEARVKVGVVVYHVPRLYNYLIQIYQMWIGYSSLSGGEFFACGLLRRGRF